MKNAQTVFSKIQELKREKRTIRKEYTDILDSQQEYAGIVEEIRKLRAKKAHLETIAKESMGSRFTRLEDVAREILSLQEMLSDISLSSLVDGQPVEVTDEYENKYEPIFKVKMKKQ